MKKLFAAILSGLLTVVAAFGVACNSETDSGLGPTDNTPVTLHVANWSSAGHALELAGTECFTEAFTEKYPNVTFEIDILDDYVNQFQNNMAAGSSKYDVFLVPDGYFGTWAPLGVMENLTDFVADSDLVDPQTIYSSAMERYMYNPSTYALGSGNIYALPKDVGPYVMYYNKDLLRELKVGNQSVYDKYEEYLTATDTFDIEAALNLWRDIKAADATLYPVGNVQIEGLVWSNGGDFIDMSTTPAKATLDTPEVAEAYQLYLDMLKEGLMPDGSATSTADPSTMFQAGTLACIITGRWAVTSYRLSDFEWDVCPVPGFSDNPELNSSSGSVGFAVHKNSQYKYWAWKFVEYCASLEGQVVGTKAGFCVPFYDTEEAVNALRAADEGKYPANTMCFVNAAKHQRRNRLSYLSYSFRWVTEIDSKSGYIFLQESDPYYKSVADFLKETNTSVTSILRVDFEEYTY